MKNEKEIYQYLGKSDYWPDLAYAGPLFDRAYYGICTSFIDGKCYSSTKTAFSQKIKENCVHICTQTVINNLGENVFGNVFIILFMFWF